MTRQAGAGGGDDINRTGGSSPRRPGTRPPPPAPPSPWLQAILWVALVGVVLVAFGTDFFGADLERELAYTEFLERVDAGDVERVTIDDQGRVSGTLDDGSAFVSAVPTAASDPNLVRRLERNRVVIEATRGRVGFWDVVLAFLPYVLLIALFFMIARRASGQAGALGMIGRSRAKVVEAARPTTRFDDVAGYEGVKREVIEVVDFLRQPDRYRQAGATGPRGVLLLGPPGTGKTLLGRAVAGEAEVPFLSVTGSSFVEMFVGVGAARVRDLFADARRRAPSIVFIDEIDAIGQRRSGAGAIAPHEEREQTLNQLLAEMDGFDPAEGVVVIAATNRPDILDPALLRPGRFDRQIVVPLPNQRERTAILAVHSRGKRLGADVDLTVVARGTPGFSGADLANLVNEAAIVAVRDGRVVLSASDFSEARDRILLGRREGSGVLLPDEKHAVAVHESGHAVVAAVLPHADPVAKVTILPAGMALGATEQLPFDERHMHSESYMRDLLTVRLGGRAAELVVLGEGSTGAANDLASATELATRMVREYGLSPDIGPVGYPSNGSAFLGPREPGRRSYAEQTQRVIDREVARLLREAEQHAIDLVIDHRDALDRLTALLLQEETVDGAAVYDLVGRGQPEAAAGVKIGPARPPAGSRKAGDQLTPSRASTVAPP